MSAPASVLRLFSSGLVLLRYDALLPKEAEAHYPPILDFCAKILRRLLAHKAQNLRPGQRLALALEALGPAFIKLGQVLSTRSDIFGAEFTDDLRHLKDQLPPFSDAIARHIVTESLGAPIETYFLEFGEVVGAASIAQAHRAVLKDGRPVVVKVLRPHIEEIIAADIAMLKMAATLIHSLSPTMRRLEPKAFTETVARSLSLEMDLRLEASAADELAQIINQEPYMSVPKIEWSLIAKRVLVMEWAQGHALSRPETLALAGLDKKALADNLIRAFLSQALNHGVFHADLHEGNLFVSAPDKIVAIDFGIIGRLKPKERRYLAEMLWGFLTRDYKRVAEVHFEAGYVPRDQNVDSFAQALRAVGEPVLGRKATEVSMGRLLTQLFEITAQFDMHLRPELVLLQKTMVSVEGVARRLYPEHNLWEAARPVVKAWISRELSPLSEIKRFIETWVQKMQEDSSDSREATDRLNALERSLNQSIKSSQSMGFIALIISLVTLVCLALALWR